MNRIRTLLVTALVAGLTVAMASFASFAASEFEGTWAVNNTKGEPFEITLAADGGAKSTCLRPTREPGRKKAALW